MDLKHISSSKKNKKFKSFFIQKLNNDKIFYLTRHKIDGKKNDNFFQRKRKINF